MNNFLAKYSGVTHAVAAVFASLSVAYVAVPQFHALVTSAYSALPSWASQTVATAIALYAWYRNGSKPAV